MTRSLLGIAIALVSVATTSAAEKSPLGRKVENFTLQDYRGKEHSLADLKDSELVVLAFLGTECPLAKLYAPRLATLAKEYESKGVAFLGVNANTHDGITAIAAHARIHKIEFPVLKDLENKLADAVAATRTPEVYVLDGERVIRYHGRIDDQYGIGYRREKPTREDLKLALDELLSGKQVSKPETEAPGCLIGRVSKPKTDAAITYSKQVSRIFADRCVECHHKGDIAPFALTSYKNAAGWAATIGEVVEEGRMPPWHASPKHGKFKNDKRLSDEEKKTILQWVADGAPEGDPKDVPAPRTYVEGWQLPRKPDLVVSMTKTPYKVPAEGVVRYQYFTAETGLKEDKWIAGAEILPGNRAVVHHILVFAIPPGLGAAALGEGGLRGYLVGYVPGKRIEPFPEGMAKKLPAGSRLVFQVHYTPNGSETTDLSKVGLIFADPKTIKYEVKTISAVQRFLSIPPKDDNYKVEATTRQATTGDTLLLAFAPHMHVRGKSFTYEAVYSDGKKETLLDVPRYDFNWQTTYRYVEPKKLPAGTKMHCVAHYDNSEKNLNNPDPNARVRWGDQTWNEMMIGYFDIAVPMNAEERKEEPKEGRAAEVMKRYDKNADGKLLRDEVPALLRATFDRLDANKDGVVTMEELTKGLPLLRPRD